MSLRAILDKKSNLYMPGTHNLNLFKGVLDEYKNGDARRTARYGTKNQTSQKNGITKMATQTDAEYYRSRGVFNDKHTIEPALLKNIHAAAKKSLGHMPHDDTIHAPVEDRPKDEPKTEPKETDEEPTPKESKESAPKEPEPEKKKRAVKVSQAEER